MTRPVPLHLVDQRHAWTADLLDSLVDAHRQHMADMPPVQAWLAVLSDGDGHVYSSIEEAVDVLGDGAAISIAVVRGSALPVDLDGTASVLLRRPTSCDHGDVAYEIGCYLDDPDDKSGGATARWAQAQAIAAALTAASKAVDR